MWYLKTCCLFRDCSHGHNVPNTSSQRIPISKLSDGSSHSWDKAQLQERQPRMVPCALAVPCARGWQGQPSSSQYSGSCTQLTGPEFVPIPQLPTTAVKIWLWVFIMLKPEGSENPFFPARAELVLSMNRTRV